MNIVSRWLQITPHFLAQGASGFKAEFTDEACTPNLSCPMTPTEKFRQAIEATGLNFDGAIVADGKIHRFRANGDRERNSWYVLHLFGDHAWGVFGCWKRSLKQSWSSYESARLSATDRNRLEALSAQAKRESEKEQEELRDRARRIARRILSRARPLSAEHPYLVAKGVSPCTELFESRGTIIVPLRDIHNKLQSLQFIRADGEKRFLRGGQAQHSFFLSDHSPGPLVLCEGVATGLSLADATGYSFACAMNCGNLPAVANAIRKKWPDRDMVVAADNDQWTEGNPGASKATEAAKAANARLAVPQFADASECPTDFNDLMRLAGCEEVKKQIDAGEIPKETDEDVFQRLAKLSPADYDRCRKSEAGRLGVRVDTLDQEVEALRTKNQQGAGQGARLKLPEIEPWGDPVDGGAVLDAVSRRVSRYVALPQPAADVIALWTCHTHALPAFIHTPRLNITSPEKGCGKSTLRDLIGTMVPRPLLCENLTVAVLFRVVDQYQPTLLLDEYDGWIWENEELRTLLNAGHSHTGQACRCVGDDHEVHAFRVFAPAVLAGIGKLPGTLADRSIQIRLVRAKPGEVTARFDSRHTETEQELARKLARWTADNLEAIKLADPSLPPTAHNRSADNWRPIFAIAEVLGGDWPHRALEGYNLIQVIDDSDSQGVGERLLADIRFAFHEKRTDKIFSKTLIEFLNGLEDGPWCETRKGRPITQSWLAGKLKSFKIFPGNIRIGDRQGKGYTLEDFVEVFERFLPEEALQGRPTVPSPEKQGSGSFSEPSQPSTWDGKNNGEPVGNGPLGRRDGSLDSCGWDGIDGDMDEVLL
jgi:putative DNA primase/helicase